jgi:hypothetical protein
MKSIQEENLKSNYIGSRAFGSDLLKSIVWVLFSLFIFAGCADDDDSSPPDPDPEMVLDLVLVAEGMTSPVGLMEAPDESGWLFVIDQVGMVWIIDENGERLEEPFLDVSRWTFSRTLKKEADL